MWMLLRATAKPQAAAATIAERRRRWMEDGKDRALKARCRTAQRYLVEGRSMPQVFWLLDTDDPATAELITGHFGDLWDIEVLRVAPQDVGAGPLA